MNQELREHFGKIAYQIAVKENGPGLEDWNELSDHAKELYCAVGEAVASDLAGMLTTPIQNRCFRHFSYSWNNPSLSR